MSLQDLSDPQAVRRAVAECDRLGREAFLDRYGFGPARRYFLLVDDQRYDSKAIVGVAHRYQFPERGPLPASAFSGGEATVQRVLERLGFTVVIDPESEPPRRGSSERRPARSPAWARDELILALDLYLRNGLLDDGDPRVAELSAVLNSLPIHTVRPDQERFRTPASVALKLANLRALDPERPGGMPHGGSLDQEVWDRYARRPEEVAALAAQLRAGALEERSGFPVAPEEGEDEVEEGRLLYRRHRDRERSRGLVDRKKRQAADLSCEVCGFDFERVYGPLGKGFIECHHLTPLSATGETKTRLADLALVCANCHRMAHRRRPWATLDDLRALIRPR